MIIATDKEILNPKMCYNGWKGAKFMAKKTAELFLQEHEMATIKTLLLAGYDIKLLPPVQGKGIKTPDLTIDGVAWEMKAPTGDGKRTVQNTLIRAGKQAENIIIDLRRSKMSEDRALKEFVKEFTMSKKLKKRKIITKVGEILDFPE